MVDTSLNKRYTAKEQVAVDYSPIPDGEYMVRVKEVSPWTAKTQNIKVIQRDEDGKALVDEKGDKVTELVNNCTFYNTNVKLEIVGGAYDGRIIFHNLSTHPNMPFAIPAFLYGLGLQELSAAEIPEKTKGCECLVDIYTDSYEKKVQNKETGLDDVEVKYINRAKNFKQLPTYTPNSQPDFDMGI